MLWWATRYETDGEDRYTGRVAGHYVWGRGKLQAVAEWAEDHDIDLDASYAYSDSFYDQHLLGAVAHGVAVNADPRLALLAIARGWPQIHLDSPPGVPKFLGIEPQQLLFQLVRSEFFPYVRFDMDGIDLLPKGGSGDHRGQPPLVFRPVGGGRDGGPGRPAGALPWQEGGV
jgi:putative phosphoserine phosphatase/1-acylglycerol-3-phosphate O-acyltransferase